VLVCKGGIYSEVAEERLHCSSFFILTEMPLPHFVMPVVLNDYVYPLGRLARCSGQAVVHHSPGQEFYTNGLLQQTAGCCHSQKPPKNKWQSDVIE